MGIGSVRVASRSERVAAAQAAVAELAQAVLEEGTGLRWSDLRPRLEPLIERAKREYRARAKVAQACRQLVRAAERLDAELARHPVPEEQRMADQARAELAAIGKGWLNYMSSGYASRLVSRSRPSDRSERGRRGATESELTMLVRALDFRPRLRALSPPEFLDPIGIDRELTDREIAAISLLHRRPVPNPDRDGGNGPRDILNDRRRLISKLRHEHSSLDESVTAAILAAAAALRSGRGGT